MKIIVRGKGYTNFTTNDFVSSGGEASIYRQGNICYKIYHNHKQMIPEAKFQELNQLKLDNIIKPENIILDTSKSIIGFTTKWVNGFPLCKVFTTGFRKRMGITDDHSIKLVKNIVETTKYIHSNNCLIVDGNEMNYLVGDDFITPYFIDTNSWKTKSFPATALMDSIKDWDNPNKFNENSDWFSFAIISCWIFTGIHPFRGVHPDYNDDDIGVRTRRRFMDRISIFHPDVILAPNVRISSIPKHYYDWYIRVFHNGERTCPPDETGIIQAVPIKVTIIKGTDNFIIKEIKEYKGEIQWYCNIFQRDIVKEDNCIWIDKTKINCSKNTNIIFSDMMQYPILIEFEDNKITYSTNENVDLKKIEFVVDEIMLVNNTLYYKIHDKFIEVEFREIKISDTNRKDKIIPIAKSSWEIMPNSSKLFSGIIYQNILGVPYLSIPIPNNSGNSLLMVSKIPELSDYKILDAKHDNHVVVLIGLNKKSDYVYIVIRFNDKYEKYDYRETPIDNLYDINMITLDTGICISIPKDGVLEAFGNKPFQNNVKVINDSNITSDMRLYKNRTVPFFIRGKSLYSIRMKQK